MSTLDNRFHLMHLTGRLTRDPELRELREGTSICHLRLAVEGMRPERAAGYIDVAVFGKAGEAAARILTRGWLVAVEGRLAHREWTGTDGGRRSAHSVIGRVEFLAAPRTNGGTPFVSEVQQLEEDERAEIPF